MARCPFLSCPFRSFHVLFFAFVPFHCPLIQSQTKMFLVFLLILHYLGPALDQGGRCGLLFRGGRWTFLLLVGWSPSLLGWRPSSSRLMSEGTPH